MPYGVAYEHFVLCFLILVHNIYENAQFFIDTEKWRGCLAKAKERERRLQELQTRYRNNKCNEYGVKKYFACLCDKNRLKIHVLISKLQVA